MASAPVPQPSTTASDPGQLVHSLRDSESQLDSALRSQILSAQPAVVPSLLETLQDEELLDANGDDGGWAPVHAAELLGKLRADEAIEPMLAVLAKIKRHCRSLGSSPASELQGAKKIWLNLPRSGSRIQLAANMEILH